MSYYVYVIWSKNLGKRYIGSTKDIGRRLEEHNKGKQRFTRGGIPWRVVYQEEFKTLGEARRREKQLKGRSGRRFLDKRIEVQ